MNLHYAGLLSVDLPEGIRRGQQFSVFVKQVTNTFGIRRGGSTGVLTSAAALNTGDAFVSASSNKRVYFFRKVLGAFQLTIPVHTKQILLVPEQRTLSLLRWIAPAIPTGSRWYPVFLRYLVYIAGRVEGFGGDPGAIKPSPTGGGAPSEGGPEDGRELAFIGKIAAVEYDMFGDFSGFSLRTEDGVRRFRATEPQIERLAREAWAERILIRVVVEQRRPSRPLAIELLRLPQLGRRHDD
jgi:hypothetical protein